MSAAAAIDTRAGTAANGPAGNWDLRSAIIILLCFVLNMIDGMDLLAISYIAPTLQKEWGANEATFSIVFSVGLAGMAVGGVVLAPLADRFGRRRLIALALAMMSLAMVASSFSESVTELAGTRFFVGCGIGTVLACIAAIAARSAPPKHRNFAVGVLQAGYPIGAMFTGFVIAWVLPQFGWRLILVATGVISVLFVPISLKILPGREGAHVSAARVPLNEALAGGTLRSSMLLWCATICGFMALYFITSWITLLSIAAGLPQAQAIIASAVYNFGAFSGTIAMSIAGVVWNIRRIGSALLLISAGVFLVFGGISMSLPGVLLTAFLMGVTLQGGFNSLYPIAAMVYPDGVRATGIGWAMGLGRIGAFTGPLIGGFALSAKLPLVAVFGIFCLPLTFASLASRLIRFDGEGAQ